MNLILILWWGATALFLAYFTPSRTIWGMLCVTGYAVFWPVVLPPYLFWFVYLDNRKPPKGPTT